MRSKIIDTSKKTARIIDTSAKPRKLSAPDLLRVLCELPQKQKDKVIYEVKIKNELA